MFKNILLDLGSSMDGRLLAQTMDFCARADAKLTVLNVFEEPSSSVASYFSHQHKDLRKLILETYEMTVEEEMTKASIDPAVVNRKTRWGKDFIETVREVREGNYDLVISASQETQGPPDSTAMHLLRKCPTPVWIHRGNLWKGAVRILAAINTTSTSSENRSLNKNILEQAVRLNDILHGHLHVVTCWSGYMESVLSSPRFTEGEKADYLEFERKQTESEMALLTESLNLPDSVKAKMVHGSPEKIIPQYAAEQKMDVVVMGSVARTGIPGLLVGNTAERIVANLENSILAIKPEGYVSPVK